MGTTFTTIISSGARNGSFSNEPTPILTDPADNLLDIITDRYALWSRSPTPIPIPVPDSALLFGSGLLGLAGYGWSQRRRAE